MEDSFFILNETKSLFASVDEKENIPKGQKSWLDEHIKTTCKQLEKILKRLEDEFQVRTKSHGQFHSFVDKKWRGVKWVMKKSEIEDWVSKIKKQNEVIKR